MFMQQRIAAHIERFEGSDVVQIFGETLQFIVRQKEQFKLSEFLQPNN